jgi:hypothetical protein
VGREHLRRGWHRRSWSYWAAQANAVSPAASVNGAGALADPDGDRRSDIRLRLAAADICNVGKHFSGMLSGSLHAWLWLVAACAGNMIGTRLGAPFGLESNASARPVVDPHAAVTNPAPVCVVCNWGRINMLQPRSAPEHAKRRVFITAYSAAFYSLSSAEQIYRSPISVDS